MPIAPWPTFAFLGRLQTSAGSFGLMNSFGGQGEPFLIIQDGKFKLFGQGARTNPEITVRPTSAEGVYTERDYNVVSVLTGWAAQATQTKIARVANTPNEEAIDTPGYLEHPLTGESLWYFEARPGTRPPAPPGGEIGAIQVATSPSRPTLSTIWTKTNQNIIVADQPFEAGFIGPPEPGQPSGIWMGGCGESTPLWRASTQKVRLFYEAITNYNPPNGVFTWSLNYADSSDGKTNWTKRLTPFWNPAQDGNIAQTLLPFRGAWQPAFCADPGDPELVHMVIMTSINRQGTVSHFQSPDFGDTWFANPNNPILRTGLLNGPPLTGSLGAPSMFVDAAGGFYWICIDGANAERGDNQFYMARGNRDGSEPPPVGSNPTPLSNAQRRSSVVLMSKRRRAVYMQPKEGIDADRR